MLRRLSIAVLGLGLAPLLFAAGPTPPETRLATPGELIISQPFHTADGLAAKGAPGFQQLIGHWEVRDGVLVGNELASDHHTASCIDRTVFTDAVITAQVQLGDAERIAILMRDDIAPNHHLARVFLTPDSLWVQHMSGISKSTKSEILEKKAAPFDPSQWYTVVIEVVGDEILARIGDQTIYAKHARFQATKGIVGMLVKGQNARFRNVAVWHATPNPAWRAPASEQ
ncbi:MAG: hypothetical protein GC160_10015 [Acidobacteria bacterium]|nr:hypothetical protein [Acidobacteriota bacterium]